MTKQDCYKKKTQVNVVYDEQLRNLLHTNLARSTPI